MLDQSEIYSPPTKRIPSEVKKKLRISRQAAALLEERTILCPVCKFRLMEVYGRDHHLTKVKCQKCKFEDIIDTALFRTVGHSQLTNARTRHRNIPLR